MYKLESGWLNSVLRIWMFLFRSDFWIKVRNLLDWIWFKLNIDFFEIFYFWDFETFLFLILIIYIRNECMLVPNEFAAISILNQQPNIILYQFIHWEWYCSVLVLNSKTDSVTFFFFFFFKAG